MRLALALVVVLAGSAAAAPKAKGTPKRQQPERTVVVDDNATPTVVLGPDSRTNHKEGEYEGVRPGEAPPHVKKKPSAAKNTLNWIGFEAKDGGATVFFQAAQPFEVTQRVEGATLVAHVALPRMGANDWRNIDTRFFENPLNGIVAKMARKGGGIEVRFSFKTASDAKEAAVRTNTEADGQFYVYLSFPPGAATGKPEIN